LTESDYDFVVATKPTLENPDKLYWSLQTERYSFHLSTYSLIVPDSTTTDGLNYLYYPCIELVEASKLPPPTPVKSTTPEDWFSDRFPLVGVIAAILIVIAFGASLIALAIRQCRASKSASNIIRGDGYIVEDGIVYGSVSGDSSIPQIIRGPKQPFKKSFQEFIQRHCSCCIAKRRGWLADGRFTPIVGPSDYELARLSSDVNKKASSGNAGTEIYG
jgi:hypothetical protein